MLLDANLLIYSVDSASPHHRRSAEFLTSVLNGNRRVGIPWQTLGAFLRISTHPRVSLRPLSPGQAWSFVDRWLSSEVAWIPSPSRATAEILGGLVSTAAVTANLIPDAQLAALAIEYGLTLYSNDSDFARFDGLRWENPLQPA